ncbi:MAG TPA: homoserine kinase [Opitutus sp.]|nr:homoserine kinase [Opitutus sp.]
MPASTSNCGAGFDSLGLALALYNRVTLARCNGTAPQAERAEDARALEMAVDTAKAFYRATKVEPRGFRFRIEGDVPPARGLGSSVTVIAGVLAGLDALCGTQLSRHALVEIATALEGHPDNASAGILGGFTVSRCDGENGTYIDSVKIEVSDQLSFVVASPHVELLTKESRGALPATLPFFDAVRSINSAAYLTAVFATGAYQKLEHAVGDFMHEPYRLPKIHGGRAAIQSGIAAGALTGWLSGSGSSVLCVCRSESAPIVSEAMTAAFRGESIASETRVLKADNSGLQIE